MKRQCERRFEFNWLKESAVSKIANVFQVIFGSKNVAGTVLAFITAIEFACFTEVADKKFIVAKTFRDAPA